MPAESVISVQNISKAYRIWESPAARLIAPVQAGLAQWLPKKSWLARRLLESAARSYRDFHALRDISFTVKRGETVGIIGRNGSGKSTLLQIIAGTMQPTAGTVAVKGRVAALLELGSGFNPEFTGRENVYLNGAVMGLSRPEIDARFERIAAFAEIGDFIEQPAKTYSSGMLMRLAFACVINVEPDILIVDEALAVGDIRFQRKCKEWIAGLAERGVTFLFVSHSPAEVAQLTETGALLDQGRLIRYGPSREVVVDYQRLLFGEEVAAPPPAAAPAPAATLPVLTGDQAEPRAGPITARFNDPDRNALIQAAARVLAASPLPVSPIEIRHGNRLAEILDCGITDERGERVTLLYSGRPYLLYFRGVALGDFNRMFAAFVIRNVNGVELFYTNTELQKLSSGPVARGELVQATSQIRMWLAPGDYFLSAVTRDGETLEALDRRLDALHFQVTAETNKGGGLVNLQPDFDFKLLGKVAG